MNQTIPYGKQTITQQDIDEVVKVLHSDYLTQGPAVEKFEKAFADYVGSKHAIAVSNGTAALHLSYLALGVKPGAKVLTTPITFAATSNAVLYCGGDVEFIDIDKENFCIDLNKLETHLDTRRGQYVGISAVDFAGYPVDFERLRSIANRYNLWVLEDACHAPGGYFTDSKMRKIKCGSGVYADVAIFSFHPVKHIACGEGGMITTNRDDLADKLKLLRTHGIERRSERLNINPGGWYHEMQELGFNYRMPDLLCALGASQLSRAEIGLQRRHEIAQYYSKNIKNHLIELPKVKEGVFHAYHLYVIKTPERLKLYNYLKENGVYAQVHYIPVFMHPYYQERYQQNNPCPNSIDYYESCLSIPMYPGLTEDDLRKVVMLLNNFKQ